jgi:serine phosphatase RsbU (regulator of sigma subunit)
MQGGGEVDKPRLASPAAPTTASRKRGWSIGTRLAATTTLVVAIAFAFLAQQLTSRERSRLLESKAQAANMVASLVAGSLAAPVDFGDAEDIRTQLDNLSANPQISAAVVYSVEDARNGSLLAEWHRDGQAALASPLDAASEGTTYGSDTLTVKREVLGRQGNVIAYVAIAFSLATENSEYRSTRMRILWGAAMIAVAVAAMLIQLSTFQIVRPLQRMVDVARRLEGGDLTAHVDRAYSGEIGALAHAFNTMGRAIAERHERLAREVEVAERIQTSILPRSPRVAGLDVSAAMLPASEVGGDYYDILPEEDGCWFGIGDVSGHGLNAGLIMLMMQSMISALTKRDPDAAPRDVISALNVALFDSVRGRLHMEHHATLTLLRYRRSGEIAFAGAHEDVIVFRADTMRCETHATSGTWVAAVADVRKPTVDSALQLRQGDFLVLHTDGVTEARNVGGEMFGPERLCAEIEQACSMGSATAAAVQAHVVGKVKRWTHVQQDDVTVVVAKYSG